MYKKQVYFIVFVFAILLLGGCGIPLSPAETPLADCFQSATAVSWLDENGNGIQDDGELPLSGIEFVLEPTVYSRTTSDENGIANISATTPGDTCPENVQVIAATFDGYTLTTAQALPYESPDDEYAFGFQLAPTTTRIETDAYTGVVFTAAATSDYLHWLYPAADSAWTPSADDVARLEDGLADFLQEQKLGHLVERLRRYTRQYLGVVEADEQLVYANFFCGAGKIDWEADIIAVDDGGDCYFHVIFNADTNTFLSIYVNGES